MRKPGGPKVSDGGVEAPVGEPALRLHHVNVKNLTLAVEPAGWAGDVAWNTTATFGTGLKQRLPPAIGTPAHALFHFRRSAFWHGHGDLGQLGLLIGVFQLVEGSPSTVPLRGGRVIYIIRGGLVHR